MAKSEKHTSTFTRQIEIALGNGRDLGRADDPAKVTFPELWEWMTRTKVGDDLIKTPATLSIRLGPEGVLVSLVDRDLQLSIETACGHLSEAFQAIEGALLSPSVAVKSWGKKEPRLRKRRPS